MHSESESAGELLLSGPRWDYNIRDDYLTCPSAGVVSLSLHPQPYTVATRTKTTKLNKSHRNAGWINKRHQTTLPVMILTKRDAPIELFSKIRLSPHGSRGS